MEIAKNILNAMQQNNEIISLPQAEKLGVSRKTLALYAKEGLLVRLRQGVYSLPDSVEDDIFTISLSSPKIIFSHETALFLNGISERTPFDHSITIPSNSCIPSAIKGKCICHYVKSELHSLGMTKLKTTFGNEVNCYNAERTICDLVRSHNKIDEETFLSGIKNYAASRTKDLALLGRYAKQFHIFDKIQFYMGVLV